MKIVRENTTIMFNLSIKQWSRTDRLNFHNGVVNDGEGVIFYTRLSKPKMAIMTYFVEAQVQTPCASLQQTKTDELGVHNIQRRILQLKKWTAQAKEATRLKHKDPRGVNKHRNVWKARGHTTDTRLPGH